MRPERVIVLPLLVVGVALLHVTPSLLLAGVALVATVAALFFAGRFVLTRNEQALVGVVALSVGILAPRALAPESLPMGAISDGMYALGLASQASAIVRLFVHRPVGGAAVTSALGLVALAAAGRASVPGLYPFFIPAFLLTAAWAVARDDAGRPRLRDLGVRHALAAALVAGLTAATVVAVDTVLPPAHARLVARIMQGVGARTGFTESLRLGEMRGLAMSTELVARVRGAPVDHLRGVVFRAYDRGGRWESVGHEPREVLELPGPPPTGERVVELELPGRIATYPLPLGAEQIWASSAVAEVEAQRILRPSAGHRAKRLAFVVGDRASPVGAARDLPTDLDLATPQTVLPILREVLQQWGAADVPPRRVVEILHERLTNDYTYSLEFQRTARLDPVVDFLVKQRRGHCEYFASAAALLARAAGLPARVVGGYRVTERSPLADYAVVRERDAHAWTEVYLDGRWETLDTTPGALGAVAESSTASALVDLLSTSWERVDDWLTERSQLELSAVLVALMLVFVGYRVWRARSRNEAAGRPVDKPLPAFVRLSRALESAGVPARPETEPIERWARRVGEADLAGNTAKDAAGVLADYAALRYGAARSEGEVVRRMASVAATLERSRPRPSASS